MIGNVLQLELIMAILIGLGIFLKHKGTISETNQNFLSDLMMNVILPCNIFVSFAQEEAGLEEMKSFAGSVIAGFAVMLFCVFLGEVVFRVFEEDTRRLFAYGLVNSNSMFIGLPVIQSLLGAPGVVHQSMYMIAARIFIWSYGLSLFTGKGSNKKDMVKDLLLHPCMLSSLLGVIVMLLKIPVPSFALRSMNYLSSCLMAVSMLLIGCVLCGMPFSNILNSKLWLFTALRLVLMPAATLGFCTLMHFEYIVTANAVLLTAMPAASITAVLATRYNCHKELACMMVAVTTLLSIAATPLWFIVLNHI